MRQDIPDSALAQALHSLAAIAPLALACIGASACIDVLALLAGRSDGVLLPLADTAVMAILGFAVTRDFLSGGEAPLPSPVTVLRDPVFHTFLQLELLATVWLEMTGRVAGFPGLGAVEPLGYAALFYAFARFGTVFPALVDGGDPGLAAAAARDTTRALLLRLLAAVALGFTMLASLILLPGAALQRSLGVESALGLAVMTPLAAAISALVTALIAVILSKAYLGRYRAGG